MTEPKKVKPLAALEARARQFLLMVGLGFLAFTVGAVVSGTLIERLSARLIAADNAALTFVVVVVVRHVWILVLQPGIIHICARFLDLSIWRAAITGAITGTFFDAAIRFVGNGVEQTLSSPANVVTWGGATVAGVLITVWAGKLGRAWADDRQKVADAAAAARKTQYDQYLADATALADKRDAARAAEAPRPAEPAAEPPKPP